ncbi:HPr kinase/phosphorylase [Sphingomonas solaris]|uniref:Aldolase n=1 Tax=Alterirhizorhabdus solaris TaxID=2529389 RepID=A0A558QZH5_9SPHN|nr:aldolase [Sphingomonas solaris]TVV72551.1 aldolase [Sphingomonas solaris]
MTDDARTIHATTIAIRHGEDWRAVLLTGRSGSGKSDLALRLIDRGAMLVADDYTDLRRDGDRLIATPPPRIAGQIEVRGIGIVAMAHLAEAPVAMVAVLDGVVERMPEPVAHTLAGVTVPGTVIAPFEASAAIRVERALAVLTPA